MATQFHDVLRDFALEKMKEFEKDETTSQNKATKPPKSTGEGDMESIKAAQDKKDERSSRERHRRHSKKDSHRHKSKKKDKKSSSSSSKHMKKNKKKSTSHHKSRHHKRKDRDQSKSKAGNVSEEVVKTVDTIRINSESEDTDAVSQQDSDEESSSNDESDSRSVSPPLQLGKDFLEGVLRDTDHVGKRVGPADDYDNVDDDGKTALQEILEERKSKKKAGLDLLSKTREMIIRRCGLEEKKPEHAGPISPKKAPESLIQERVTTLPGLEHSDIKPNDLKTDSNVSRLKDDKKTSGISAKGTRQEIKKGHVQNVSPDVSLKGSTEIKTMNQRPPLRGVESKDEGAQKTLSDSSAQPSSPEASKLVNDVVDSSNETVDSQNNNTSKVSDEKVSDESGDGNIGPEKSTIGDGAPVISKETNNGSKGPQNTQGKGKMIQIKIKTLELPTDSTKVDDDRDVDEDSEGDDDDGHEDGTITGKPWRIVPEEGELTPSTASDEGHEMLEDALKEADPEQKGKDPKGSSSDSRRHKKSKKRRKDGREEGEINEKKKKRRHRDQSEGGDSKKSAKDDERKTSSKSPDRKKVKSSVVSKGDSSRRSPYRSRSRSRHRSRSRSGGGLSHRSKSRSPGYRRSRSPGRYRRSRSPYSRRSRSRSWSPDRRRGFDLRDKLSRSRDRRRDRSRSRSRDRRRRERSYTPVEEIDKKKLLEIAKANAYLYQKVQSGELPANTPFPQIDTKKGSQGSKTVEELTEVCKSFSKQGDEDSSDEEPVNVPATSDDESFIRHPFQVKERASSIVLNIQNAIPMPTQTSKEMLRVQFPVSSGTKHREKADTLPEGPFGSWEPVKKPEPKATPSTSTGTAATAAGKVNPTPVTPAVPLSSVPLAPSVPPEPVPEEHKVFTDIPPAEENLNIADVIAMRLKAARQLQTNPLDVEALTSMHKAQSRLRNWANKDNKPGLFTGQTDANILTPEQLANPNPKNQAWAKKDMFHNHVPVRGGIGMQLLQKMGWKQGEGLGKKKDGQTLPLMLDVKMDRKGLAVKGVTNVRKPRVIMQQNRQQKPKPVQVNMDLTGKHPVSALNELCSKRKWRQPEYVVLRDVGPPHKKEFIYKVVFNGEEFAGSMACNNKKEAKALAAQTALVKLGLVPNPST